MKKYMLIFISFLVFIIAFPSVCARLSAPGYGWCKKCKFPWKYVKGHTTDYSLTRGIFPLCEKCWRKLGTPERRMPYYKNLWESWGDPKPKWETIEKAVKEEI